MDANRGVMLKCDLCSGDPKCVKFCLPKALVDERSEVIDNLRQNSAVQNFIKPVLKSREIAYQEKKEGKIMNGWMGIILRVDLTEKKITKVPLDKNLALKFIGGRGLNGITLYKELKPGLYLLKSPENIIIFGVGPCNGTLSLASGRFNVTSKSPLT